MGWLYWPQEIHLPRSFEVRSSTGALLSSRLVPVDDMAPEVSVELVDASGTPLERVRGGGNEFLRISFWMLMTQHHLLRATW